ncbi:hypothetical protein GCK72_002906 [Caenorhabditis remanei]|uniref:pyridoxal kinase n=1 Tax=Caenorhabditis remanei TaxID=31234 RepID=A0A6A5HVA5_CAERE|nr:hypothetical protein GCK72_002906 [Caenorhabditis remanei]KAF1771081.1 hypothetical protein GCK72_002906 [Caenorhabditis remanei]
MTNAEVVAELERERDRRVLSIQSHVVHGYAGNKCSVFPLQLHGFEVDAINSVQFSNHAGYETVKGQKLTEKELEDLYEGLTANKINNYTHVLTGYCGNVTFLQKIADVVKDLKQKDPETKFVCDPVMGDNGRYYTPKELMPVYRDLIIPLADVLTPNAFELGELTGSPIETEEDCLKAVGELHAKGVKTIVVTSGVTGAQTQESLRCYASVQGSDCYRFTFPRLMGQFVGTGDVFASLLVVWLDELNGDISEAVKKVLSSLQCLIRKTSDYAQLQVDTNSRAMCELRLIQSRKELLWPPSCDKIHVEKVGK